mgnify:CR=1 FL=1
MMPRELGVGHRVQMRVVFVMLGGALCLIGLGAQVNSARAGQKQILHFVRVGGAHVGT